MSFCRISVLVPTRQRIPQLERLLESFAATVPDDDAELIFRVDRDDLDSQACLRRHSWTVVVGPRYEGYRSLPRFCEEMRDAATGDVFMVGNDDMVFRTTHWPARLLSVANEYPDGRFNLSVSTYNEHVVPWSTVSRQAVDQLGHIHDARLYWGDVYLRDVFAAFGRVIAVPDVQIDHVWMGHTPDQTFLEANQGEARNWDEAYWALHRRCVSEAVAKLEAACLTAH